MVFFCFPCAMGQMLNESRVRSSPVIVAQPQGKQSFFSLREDQLLFSCGSDIDIDSSQYQSK